MTCCFFKPLFSYFWLLVQTCMQFCSNHNIFFITWISQLLVLPKCRGWRPTLRKTQNQPVWPSTDSCRWLSQLCPNTGRRRSSASWTSDMTDLWHHEFVTSWTSDFSTNKPATPQTCDTMNVWHELVTSAHMNQWHHRWVTSWTSDHNTHNVQMYMI